MVDGIDIREFSQPLTVRELQGTNCSKVSKHKGVYLVLQSSIENPRFLATSVGGWYKGLDPSYPQEFVKEQWVDGARVLYVGKANGKNGLCQRLRQLVQFGMGKAVAHRGGRLIWHLANNPDLIVQWRELSDRDPGQVETQLIAAFKGTHGRRPYANLQK